MARKTLELSCETPLWFTDIKATPKPYLDLNAIYAVGEEERQLKKDAKGQQSSFMGFPSDFIGPFCAHLASDTTIERLNLEGVNFNIFGIKKLGEALQQNSTLRWLNLKHNNLPAVEIDKFVTRLAQRNFTLCECLIEEEPDKEEEFTKACESYESFTLDTVWGGMTGGTSNIDPQKLYNDALNKLQIILEGNRSYVATKARESDTVVLKGRHKPTPSTIASLLRSLATYNIRVLEFEDTNLPSLPTEIGLLGSLEELRIINCGLRSVPNSIGFLSKLQILNLAGNHLSQLPDAFALLTNLVKVSVRENVELADLPISLVQSSKVKVCMTQNCSLSAMGGLPKEVRRDNTGEKLLGYMRGLYKGKRYVNRCKLMFVGDGNVGKTSLVGSLKRIVSHGKKAARKASKKKLVQERIIPAYGNIATDGIDIHLLPMSANVKYSPPDEKKIYFSLWDFAGQEIYYATHQFFLSERAIYLVCMKSTADENELNRVEYWLQSIQARAPKAPTFLVCSHLDNKICTKPYLKELRGKLSERFGVRFKSNLVGLHFISNETLKGVDELQTQIIKTCTNVKYKRKCGIEEEQPASWLRLEEAAKGLTATLPVPVILYKKWEKRALESCGFDTKAEVALATKFLHDTGAIVYFDEQESGLNEHVILDSSWLTEVFATVVTMKTNMVRGGILNHRDLGHIWKLPLFPPEIHPFLLATLEKFDLLHRLEGNAINNIDMLRASQNLGNVSELLGINTVMRLDTLSGENAVAGAAMIPATIAPIENEGRSIVPCLLNEKPPRQEDIEAVFPSGVDTATQLNRVYTLSFLPNGFFERLMVRLLHSRWEAKIFWRSGIVLEKQNSRLFLKLTKKVGSFRIEVLLRGPDGAKMGPLMESIDTLISDWLSVDYTISVPCSDCILNNRSAPHHYDMKTLETLIGKGKSFVTCPNSRLPIRVDALVPDLTMGDILSDAMKISYATLKLNKELGVGGFAVVYKGSYQGRDVAVKKLTITEHDEDNDAQSLSKIFGEFRREVWLMSRISHENIVSLVGVCSSPDPYCMVLEFMDAGDLYEFVHPRPEDGREYDSTPWELRLKLALDVAKAMEYMHSLNPPIIHRDLKSPNVLLTKRGAPPGFLTAKVADFGLSRGLYWTTGYTGKDVDNPVWLAPEVIRRKPYSEKVDVYAFGVILWELASGEEFYGECKFFSEIENRVLAGDRPLVPESAPDYISVITQVCWDDDPNNRPSFDAVVTAMKTKKPPLITEPPKVTFSANYDPRPPTKDELQNATNKSKITKITKPTKRAPGRPVKLRTHSHSAGSRGSSYGAALSNSAPQYPQATFERGKYGTRSHASKRSTIQMTTRRKRQTAPPSPGFSPTKPTVPPKPQRLNSTPLPRGVGRGTQSPSPMYKPRM